MTLLEFLENKTLFYDKIDYDCISKSWNILSTKVKLPYVIHIIGTNGKGSTGRYLASFLHQLEYDVVHYSSPHIIDFNERIWINGRDSYDDELELGHSILQSELPSIFLDQLTYFEYTTLLALVLSSQRDYLVLEAGLGGEFDATNVVKNNLTLLTNIGLDHQNFLGDTIKEIAQTKIRSCDDAIIVSIQESDEVYDIVEEVLENKKIIVVRSSLEKYTEYLYNIPTYLQNNLYTVFNALDYMKLPIKKFSLPRLFGRFEYFKDNIIIDVGHNPLAATAIAKELKSRDLKVDLIFNSYADKDYIQNLTILKPYLNSVYIIECNDKRIVEKAELVNGFKKLQIEYSDFHKDIICNEKKYLVFGSFLVVENFLKIIN